MGTNEFEGEYVEADDGLIRFHSQHNQKDHGRRKGSTDARDFVNGRTDSINPTTHDRQWAADRLKSGKVNPDMRARYRQLAGDYYRP